MTIRDLLAHTSGIADPDPAEIIALFRQNSGQRFEYRDLIAFADIPTNNDPHAGEFAYANSGYHVLGGVIEATTGTDVATALRTHVLDPAGLTQTRLAGAEPVPTAIVPGNVDLDGDGHEDTLACIPYLAVETHMWSAGALASTADDVISSLRPVGEGHSDTCADGKNLACLRNVCLRWRSPTGRVRRGRFRMRPCSLH